MAAVSSAPTDLFPKPILCSVCGDQAQSFWTEGQTVAFCASCAHRVLPALLADSLSCLDGRVLDTVIAQFEARFWRAALFAAQRRREKR